MNILTFDIEEWYLEKTYFGNRPERFKAFDSVLDNLLGQLDERGVKATFFCVGGMAREFQEVVRKIYDRGHEIGCHSDKHVWLNKMMREEVLEDTRCAVDSLEQCIGSKVLSYRAPAFSIGNSNKWAFEVLASCGIERDASIFPGVRDFGGFAEFEQKTPTLVKCDGIEIHEFPICTARICGKEVAYSGGGYFRFFPLSFIKKTMRASDYVMTYFHINDLEYHPYKLMTREAYESYFKQSGTFKNRLVRMVKGSIGSGCAFDKMCSLVRAFDYVNLEEADKAIDWKDAKVVQL